MKQVFSHTMALCSYCKKKVQARIVEIAGKVYLEKWCPEHDRMQVLISSDAAWYRESRAYIKPKQLPLSVQMPAFTGCPDSCGFCTEHQQHACLPVIEINNVCNLDCPVCLKNFKALPMITTEQFAKIIDNLFTVEGCVPVINLSGGEPLLHPGLYEMLSYAKQKGVSQVSVSTNGLLLHEQPVLRKKLKESGAIIALQFDGFSDATYTVLRGAALAQKKLAIIEQLEAEDVPYSLVATVAKGINEHEIEQITNFFFAGKACTLMFQPVAYTGNAAERLKFPDEPLTIPDVVRKIEKSSYVKPGDFNPLPCSHYSCFALSYYLKTSEQRFVSLKDFLGKESYLSVIANKTLPGLDREGQEIMKEKLYALWSAGDSCDADEHILKRIREIILDLNETGRDAGKAIALGKQHMKAIFVHHFMDAANFDFARAVKCCNPYAFSENRLVPMCVQNCCNQVSL